MRLGTMSVLRAKVVHNVHRIMMEQKRIAHQGSFLRCHILTVCNEKREKKADSLKQ